MRPNWWERALDTIADRGRELLNLPGDNRRPLPCTELCRKLLSSRGEASGIALAREILQQYEAMSADDRLAFFEMLEHEFGPDVQDIESATARYTETRAVEDFLALSAAVEPPRQELFRGLNMAPHGTAALVRMRGDLLGLLGGHPRLKAVDADLAHLLGSWFNRGFLRLERIDWHSPADLLEKLIHYESVHPIDGWADLQRRLADDRCCFAFFHPAMPDEPLIFVEVAHTTEIASRIQPLLDIDAPVLDPGEGDTALFYSINNTQVGLRGISFGNFLIKQVLTEFGAECAHIKQFATLSPMPRLRQTLEAALAGAPRGLTREFLDTLLADTAQGLCEAAGAASATEALVTLAGQEAADHVDVLAEPLQRVALAYLTTPRGRSVIDPVAAFHLANGARLERINVFADDSSHGMQASWGVMVNYLYEPRDIERNHESFANKGEIAMSRELAKTFKRIAALREAPESDARRAAGS